MVKEFCETFASGEDDLKRGFGFAPPHHGQLVSGASTMTVEDGGTEIQVQHAKITAERDLHFLAWRRWT
jgi:hypothetical protein